MAELTDEQARHLAYELMSTAWAGMTDPDRDTVVDLLYTGDYTLALVYLLDSTAPLDPDLVKQARDALDAAQIAHA